MRQENIHLVSEFILIFILICLLLFIPGNAFFVLLPVVPLALLAGLIWSVLFKGSARVDMIITNIGAVGILIWFFYALSHSYFGYKEVLLILLKTVVFLITVFCFCASTSRYRTYIIFLSVPLCMGAVLYSQHSTLFSGICLLGVIFCWLVLVKVRFAQVFGFRESKGQRWLKFLVFPGIICAVVVLCAAFVFFALSTPYLKKAGFFDSADLADTGELEALEEQYYLAQDKFQDQSSTQAPNLKIPEDRHAIMKMISQMVKEPADVLEVEKADQGLIGLLRTPGLGIKKGQGEEVTYALNHYAEIKSMINVLRQSDQIMQKVRVEKTGFFKAISMLISLGSMRLSSEHKDIIAASKQLERKIDALEISESARSDLNQQAKELAQWRVFWAFSKQVRLLRAQLDSTLISVQNDFRNIIFRIEEMRTVQDVRVALKEIARIKQEHPAAGNYSRKLDEIMALRMEMFLAGKEQELMEASLVKSTALRKEEMDVAQAIVPADTHEQIENQLLKDTQEFKDVLMFEAKKEQALFSRSLEEEAAKRQEEKDSLLWRKISFLGWGILLFLLCAGLGFFIYRWLVMQLKRGKLVADYAHPRSFIINLYANLRRIIVIFGMRQRDQLPPLLQAAYIGGKYNISVTDFIVFSEKFEEARYSQHALTVNDSLGALNAYNSFLDILLQQDKLLKRWKRILFSILGGIPLKITCA